MRWEIYIGPPIRPLKIGPCLGLALWAEVVAQALSTYRVVPALSTINRASGRAKAVLFRAVPRAANHARPIWNTIFQTAQATNITTGFSLFFLRTWNQTWREKTQATRR
jgi:hypothetical protein